MEHDDDLVMESTTDSPEQIADGLGVELTPAVPADDADASLEAADDLDADATDGDPEAEPSVGEVTPPAARVAATKQKAVAPRAQRKSVNGAAAAARRASEARQSVLQAENDALRERLKEIAPGQTIPPKAVVAVPATNVVTVTADSVPDGHPDVAAVLAQITKLGPKPKQGDFDDFEKFEDAKDTWLMERGSLSARSELVREDVARRATIANDEANRAAKATAAAWATSVEDAKSAHDDYDEVMDNATAAGHTVSRDVATALMESTIGARVLHFLAKHPDEIVKLNKLSIHRQIAEVGKIEGRIAATLRTTPGHGRDTRPGARLTRAPDPQQTLIGDLPSRGQSREERLNDPTLTQAEYNRIRNDMDRDSGRRLH